MKRWPVVAAALYVTAVVIGLFVVPRAPGIDVSGTTLVSYYAHHARGIRITAWLGATSLIPFALVSAHLRGRLKGVARDAFGYGTVGVFTGTAIWLWFGAGVALHTEVLRPATARTLADIASYFGPVLTVSVILMVAPVTLMAWRGENIFPRWLGAFGAAFVIEQSVETLTILSTHGFTAPGGDMNLTLGAGLFLVWILAASIATPAEPRA